jgi:hypothetical protein
MQRFLFALAGLLACVSMAEAQVTVPTYIVTPGSTVNVTVNGTAGQNYAVIASTLNSGFSYGGVPLQVGPDVVILAIGVLGGTGQAVVPVTPPFPAQDRYYVQGVVAASPDFLPPSPLNSVTLVNADAARAFMPIGGIVNANGTPAFVTSGVTVTRLGVGLYQIDHPGAFSIPTAIPTITPTGGAVVLAVSTNSNVTTVSLSADAIFFFTIQSIRR